MSLTNPPAQQLVDGKLSGASDGTSYPILNPATGEQIGVAPDSTAADVDAAIAAARRAFDETDWSTNVELRVRCLRQLHQALLDHADEFRALTTAEVGMPGFMMGAAGFDVPVEGLKWVTDLLESYEWESDLGVAQPMGIPTRRTVVREPVGVVAAITPWNVPNQINLAKVGPALAAGCTVVLKPATGHPVGGLRARALRRRAHRHPGRRLQRGDAALQRGRRGPVVPIRGSTWCRSPARPTPAGRSWRPRRRR